MNEEYTLAPKTYGFYDIINSGIVTLISFFITVLALLTTMFMRQTLTTSDTLSIFTASLFIFYEIFFYCILSHVVFMVIVNGTNYFYEKKEFQYSKVFDICIILSDFIVSTVSIILFLVNQYYKLNNPTFLLYPYTIGSVLSLRCIYVNNNFL